MKVLNGCVLLKLYESGEKTKSGLYISHSKGERTEAWALKARVIAFDEYPQDEEVKTLEIKKDDVVYISKWEIHRAQINGEEYAIAKMKDILLKI